MVPKLAKKTNLIEELKKVITDYMNKKMGSAGISYENLLNAFDSSNEFGIENLVCKNREKGITKDKNILKQIKQ